MIAIHKIEKKLIGHRTRFENDDRKTTIYHSHELNRIEKSRSFVYVRALVSIQYVIGLHAVQFGNNWVKRITRMDEAVGCYLLII